jgi:hypothetical protein
MDAFLISQSIAIFWLENSLAGCNKNLSLGKKKLTSQNHRFPKRAIYFNTLITYSDFV